VPVLLFSVLLAAICGIIYELLIGAAASYLLGDSVRQFSITVGLFMTAMGVGSYLSRQIGGNLLVAFLWTELGLALLGGFSALALFVAYSVSDLAVPAMYALIVGIGSLVGLEIPLVMRLLERHVALRASVADVLGLDYVGGLVGALLFPLLLLPHLGLVRAALAVGLLNVVVVAVVCIRGRRYLPPRSRLPAACALVGLALAAGVWRAAPAQAYLEQRLYRDQVLYSRDTTYQHLTLTRWNRDLRLFINGNLEFSSIDEYRYHEALVHIPVALARPPERVLILGGGDGLAVREVLKYPSVQHVTVVDIDPEVVRLARTLPELKALNGGALADSRVAVGHEDAFRFLERNEERFGLVVSDLPDPNNEALAKLYTREMFRLAARALAADGVLVTQASSPYFAREAFWCIAATVAASGLETRPYHVYVPSFGDWGFVAAGRRGALRSTPGLADLDYRFLTASVARECFSFPRDAGPPRSSAPVNTLMTPILLALYNRGWDGMRQ
jgi:spermidine synthase